MPGQPGTVAAPGRVPKSPVKAEALDGPALIGEPGCGLARVPHQPRTASLALLLRSALSGTVKLKPRGAMRR